MPALLSDLRQVTGFLGLTFPHALGLLGEPGTTGKHKAPHVGPAEAPR